MVRLVVLLCSPTCYLNLFRSRAYDGSLLAWRGDLVVAIPNYRVGLMGFAKGNDTDSPGNLGLHDQLSALRWLKANVGFFGGNASRIVLVGHGSGAASVGYFLLRGPLEVDDVQRFVFLSGSPFARQVLCIVKYVPVSNGQRLSNENRCSARRRSEPEYRVTTVTTNWL